MVVAAITNNLLYHANTQADLEALGSDDGIVTDTIAWVEDMKTWCWPDVILAASSTWLCGDLSGSRSWGFQTNSTTGYAGGFYDFAATPDDFNLGPTFGTANVARAAHFFIVTGAVPGGAVTIRVTGTSITDAGVRTASDTEDIVVAGSTAINSYFETTKKWNGQVTITVFAGTPINCNYGWTKYYDADNQNFVVLGLECLWESDATDSTSDIEMRHHTDIGWTFNPASPPTPPAAVAARSVDYGVENDQEVGPGAWKRTDLSLAVAGSGLGGIIFEVTSGTTGVGTLSFRSMTVAISFRIS